MMSKSAFFLKKLELLCLAGAVCFFAACFVSCKTNIQSMLDDYNSQFIPTEDKVVPPCPGDPDFDEKKMLFSTYYVCSEGTINLAAPTSASYNWKLLDSEKNVVVIIKKREFVYYLPTSFYDIKAGTYQIRLEVKDANGLSYTDTATVVIYDRLK